VAVLFGAAYDIPIRAWNAGWFLRQALIIGVLVVWVAVSRAVWWRGRPLPTVLGARVVTFCCVGLGVLYGLASLAGLGLQALGVSLPFTIAGLLFGVVLVALIVLVERPLRATYHGRVEKGHW